MDGKFLQVQVFTRISQFLFYFNLLYLRNKSAKFERAAPNHFKVTMLFVFVTLFFLICLTRIINNFVYYIIFKPDIHFCHKITCGKSGCRA